MKGQLVRTPEFVAEVARMQMDGMSRTEIARKMKVSTYAIRAAIIHGAGKEPNRLRIPQRTRDIVRRLSAQGLSTYEIAAQCGIHRESVPRIIAEQPEPRPEAVLPARMTVRMPERVARMRDSFKARGMSHENATREAMRICSGSAAGELGGASRAAGGGSFHSQSMQEISQ